MVDVSPGNAISNFAATQRAQLQLSRSVGETSVERAREARRDFIRSGGGSEPQRAEAQEYATPYNAPVAQDREARVSGEEYNDQYFDRMADPRADQARQADIASDLRQSGENDRLSGASYQTGVQTSQLIEAADQRRQDARAAETSAQVQQQFDVRRAEQNLAGAQNNPSLPRGSYVDIRA